jgi:drug/metabolite transporter (DMT)-like permease
MKSTSKLNVSPLLVLFLGIFAVSTSSVFIRLAQREASSLAVAAYRLSIASVLLVPFIWQKREELKAMKWDRWRLVLISGCFLAVHFATWISSLAFTSVASSVVLVTTTPLWVALLSPLFLHEHPKPRLWGGLAIALAGGVIVGMNEACQLSASGLTCAPLSSFFAGKAFLGDVLALIGALMAAGYMIAGRRLRPSLSLAGYIGTVYPVAAIVLDGMALASGVTMSGFTLPTIVVFAALAMIPQLLGHTSYNYALGYLPAAYVSIATLAEPIGTTLLAILVLGELPTPLEVTGGLIILCGIGLASWRRN